jgi:hypothetical protein
MMDKEMKKSKLINKEKTIDILSDKDVLDMTISFYVYKDETEKQMKARQDKWNQVIETSIFAINMLCSTAYKSDGKCMGYQSNNQTIGICQSCKKNIYNLNGERNAARCN